MRVCGHQNKELLGNLFLEDPGAQVGEQRQAVEQQAALEVEDLSEGQQEDILGGQGEQESHSGEQGAAGHCSKEAGVNQQERGPSQEQSLGKTRLETARARASTLGELEPG